MVSECTCRCGQLAQECASSQVALGKMPVQVGVDREAFDEPCPAWSIRVRRVGRVAPILRVEDNGRGSFVERPKESKFAGSWNGVEDWDGPDCHGPGCCVFGEDYRDAGAPKQQLTVPGLAGANECLDDCPGNACTCVTIPIGNDPDVVARGRITNGVGQAH